MPKRKSRMWWWRWRRNPLRRRSDVFEAWAGVVAVMVVLLTAPVVGVTAAGAAERSALDQGRGLHHVSARLLEDATAIPSRFSGTAGGEGARATVRWTTSDGSSASGRASVAADSRAGSHTTVWLDDADRIQPAPPTPAQAEAQGAALGAASGMGTGVLVLGAWWVVRMRLDARRSVWWDRAWAAFDTPQGHRQA
ncbi:Rv1733c family protein [Streptomyces griseoruber]|uniref:Rv1733c family protein n=1 Tax=Streptomyces griseoruber TaxID=1943 RepID=UPI0037AA60F3